MIPLHFLSYRNAIDAIDARIIHNSLIQEVSIDSRSIEDPSGCLFIALKGSITDGHNYIKECIDKGVRNFIISDDNVLHSLQGCDYILVDNTLDALQKLSAYHRHQYNGTVIGITGSNGKTTVKEWLHYLLSQFHTVGKSPGSFNSQIGVPLSAFELSNGQDFSILEAGISRPLEMDKLQIIIDPDIGIFTNIGEAHSTGFDSLDEKIQEKIKLFSHCKHIIVCAEHKEILNAIYSCELNGQIHTWGYDQESTLFCIKSIDRGKETSFLNIEIDQKQHQLEVNFTDEGSIQNILHSISILLLLDINLKAITPLLSNVRSLPLRLEMYPGPNDTMIINDAYNHDLTSLKNTLAFANKQKGNKKILAILSDLEESSTSTHRKMEELFVHTKVDEVWWLGNQGNQIAHKVFSSKPDLIRAIRNHDFYNQIILIKGSRRLQFDQLASLFEQKSHSATLEIDLSALDQNVQIYGNMLSDNTGIIAVIKAGAYGSGSEQLAQLLQHRGIKFLAVAFVDEGIELRKSGISLPIIVLNPDRLSMHALFKYDLQPEIYSLNQLVEFIRWQNRHEQKLPIHLKLDTGMHRLGFDKESLSSALQLINQHQIKVSTVFSHLASSENPKEDVFSNHQFDKFKELIEDVKECLDYDPLLHICNTSAIVRFPEMHLDLVRLGLGMYGIDSTRSVARKLDKVHTLTARIIQIKKVQEGSSIGYNQEEIANADMTIAIVNIGYADGLPRLAGNRKYSFYIHGKLAPIIGNVCMDLTIIDITHCSECQDGDVVEVFGKNQPIEQLAQIAGTIPYEILVQISGRIRKEWTHG